MIANLSSSSIKEKPPPLISDFQITSPEEFKHTSPNSSSKTNILSLEIDNPVTLPSDFQNSKSSPF